MPYYPVFLDIKGRACLVVGGGAVGTRKVEKLLECEASVTVVSCRASEKLKMFSNEHRIRLKERAYRISDLQGKFLVIGATDDEGLNRQLSRDAEQHNLLCNIADRPAECNFILPSIIRQGDLVIAISTSGKSPAFAKKLRLDLEKQFDEAYGVFLELMGAVRQRLLRESHVPEEHKPLFQKIIHSDIVAMIQQHRFEDIDHLLFDVLGPGYAIDDLLKSHRQR